MAYHEMTRWGVYSETACLLMNIRESGLLSLFWDKEINPLTTDIHQAFLGELGLRPEEFSWIWVLKKAEYLKTPEELRQKMQEPPGEKLAEAFKNFCQWVERHDREDFCQKVGWDENGLEIFEFSNHFPHLRAPADPF